MKKIILLASILLSSLAINAQTNQIDTTGNVGIGTTSPNTPLEVVGSSALRGNVAIDSSITIGDSMVVERDVKIKNDLRVDGKGIFEGKLVTKRSIVAHKDAIIRRDIVMEDYADSISTYGLLFLDEDGRTYPVDEDDFVRLIIDNAYPEECFQDPFGNVIHTPPIWHTKAPNVLYTGIEHCEGEAMVGINESDPEGNLHIVGYVTDSTDNLMKIERRTTGVKHHVLDIDGHGNTHISIYENGASYQKVFVIRNATSHETLLQLEQTGLLRAREIKVDMGSWPDYVFEEDYVLMPLTEVENFIKQNGHLPNVKSAEEIEKEGLNVGEANKMLMEKIEEMTLYLIELEKKVNALEKKLDDKNN